MNIERLRCEWHGLAICGTLDRGGPGADEVCEVECEVNIPDELWDFLYGKYGHQMVDKLMESR